MGIVKVTIQNINWRKGRPRFDPGPGVRRLGFRSEDLKHADGRWFSLDEAGAWAAERNAAIAARRQQKAEGKRLAPLKRPKHQTIEGLFDEWFESPKFTGGVQAGKRQQAGVTAATARDYRYKFNALKAFDAELMQEAPGAVTAVVAQGIFDKLWERKGLHTARGVVAIASSCWKWAIGRGKGGITFNPWRGLEKAMPAPRLVTWTDEEIVALAAAADALGRPEIGDAVYLGLFTGQRQGDRLTLERAGRDDAGRLLIRQSKTGAIVAVPAAPQLVARLEAAAARRKDRKVQHTQLVIDETANAPFKSDWYRHVFAEMRLAAARGVVLGMNGPEIAPAERTGHEVWLLMPVPSIAGKRDQDLRDTAVTWLGRASATVPQIASITGHSYVSINQVLRHYLATHPEMADAAIGKLLSWMDETGVAV
ncbi:hypothetical protein V5F49_11100 [Xanthobacter sp. V3C-3]|uniref:hypothetical protein n=1 Tax=Xanthobacter lutulentifluminis TaxID=3119935 RepID=UPI0037298B7A